MIYDQASINYQFLRDGLEKLKNTYGSDVIVDLSGVPKRVAIDTLTACLAAGIEKITLFELEKLGSPSELLYHNLKKGDYEHVVLPNWEPLIGNIRFFSVRENRQKLRSVVVSILASMLLLITYQVVSIFWGGMNWFSWLLVFAIAVIGLVGGITPIMEAWGGVRSVAKPGERST